MEKITQLVNKFFNRIQVIISSELIKSHDSIDKRLTNEIHKLKFANSSEIQTVIKNQYLLFKNGPLNNLPKLSDCGFQVYSQFEEDGLLLYIFSMIGTTNKRVVEICAGDATECMASNLIINHCWEGMLFDGDEESVKRGIKFFKSNPSTAVILPKFIHSWITKDNINELIKTNGFEGEIDLLSLDIDGNDYWLLKDLDVIQPRVIICETQDIIPSDLALTIPYNPSFYYKNLPKDEQDFRSVSLLAMKKLCNAKGYRLIGSHRYGFNVIFLRNDIAVDIFPEVSIDSIHNNPWTHYGQKERWPKVNHLNWQEV